MMSFHIAAKRNEIAETVFISGDPLRIKYMANIFLKDAVCVNEIRGMYAYTGMYRGQRVTMLGTGIGIPSTLVFLNELANHYDVKQIIRLGTMGAIQPDLTIGQLVLASSASSDSGINRRTFGGLDFAPTADFDLLNKAYSQSKSQNIDIRVGQIFSTDMFYLEDDNRWDIWRNHQVLGVEMETSAIYTLAAKHKLKALSILTVSDNLITKESSLPEVREKHFKEMFELGLSLVE